MFHHYACNSEKLQICPSFLCVVLIPYLRRKLETLFQKCREDKADGVMPSNPVVNHIREIFLSLYPSLHFLTEAVNIGMTKCSIFYLQTEQMQGFLSASPWGRVSTTALCPGCSGSTWSMSLQTGRRRRKTESRTLFGVKSFLTDVLLMCLC